MPMRCVRYERARDDAGRTARRCSKDAASRRTARRPSAAARERVGAREVRPGGRRRVLQRQVVSAQRAARKVPLRRRAAARAQSPDCSRPTSIRRRRRSPNSSTDRTTKPPPSTRTAAPSAFRSTRSAASSPSARRSRQLCTTRPSRRDATRRRACIVEDRFAVSGSGVRRRRHAGPRIDQSGAPARDAAVSAGRRRRALPDRHAAAVHRRRRLVSRHHPPAYRVDLHRADEDRFVAQRRKATAERWEDAYDAHRAPGRGARTRHVRASAFGARIRTKGYSTATPLRSTRAAFRSF